MSLQSIAMRATVKKEVLVAKDENGFFGIEYVCHPTPSGFERWLPTFSDKRRFEDKDVALNEFKEQLTKLENYVKENG